jgi:hypothetical protein
VISTNIDGHQELSSRTHIPTSTAVRALDSSAHRVSLTSLQTVLCVRILLKALVTQTILTDRALLGPLHGFYMVLATMFESHISALILLLWTASVAVSTVSSNTVPGDTFISPPAQAAPGQYGSNQRWELGSQNTISWTCDYAKYSLWIFQNNDDGNGSPQLIRKSLLPAIRGPRLTPCQTRALHPRPTQDHSSSTMPSGPLILTSMYPNLPFSGFVSMRGPTQVVRASTLTTSI